ncbi:hypothetical protein DFQ30_001766 [Apophysomyces sp. BC1015]|nr:hypothetical protein DFQ30_001766 [Apophysomyces sp. BC1015]
MNSHKHASPPSTPDTTNPIDEWQIKSKFVEIAQATIRSDRPHPTKVVVRFDAHDNVRTLVLSFADSQTREKSFYGNPQYIPPETAVHAIYHRERTDVWILGISLYRMLTGRYPFKASNDRLLFKKMLHADFTIPRHLSDDAKDLLRRMLTTDATRASLDLIMFHPWLKPFCLDIPPNVRPTSLPQPSPFPVPPSPIIPQSPSTSTTNSPVGKMKTGLAKIFLFLIEGPYPPPRRPYQDLLHIRQPL